MSNQNFFHYVTFQQQIKHKINKQKTFHDCHLYLFIGAMETNVSSRMVSYSSLFLHSLHLHNLLPMILHESGNQQYRVFMITGPRYVNLIPFKVPFNSENYSLQFRLKGTTTRKHNFNLKCIRLCSCNTNDLQHVSWERSKQEKGI